MDKSHVGMFNCFYCNQEMGILLDSRLKDSLPMNCGIIGYEPCNECKEWMEQGILLISVKDGEPDKIEKGHKRALADYEQEKAFKSATWKRKHPFESRWMPNPYRTGGWCIITEEAFTNVFNGPVVKQVLECRWTFIEDKVWDATGLPREDVIIEQAA